LERVRTYIDELDEKLDGGFLKKMALLLYGQPGVGKSTLALQLTINQCLNKNIVIYITCDMHPSDIELMVNTYWKNILSNIQKENFIIVDGYSWRIGKNIGKYNVSLQNLSDFFSNLIDIIENISNLREKMPIMIIIDSISSVIEYNDITAVYKFLQTLIAVNNEWKIIFIFIMEEGVHRLIEMKKIEYIMDGLIHLHRNNLYYEIEIPYIKLTKPVKNIKFIINNNGIKLIK